MTVDFGVLKDAADAADKLTDVVRKIAGMIVDSAKAGVEFVEWIKVVRLSHTIQFLQYQTTALWTRQVILQRAKFRQFLDHPTGENWMEVQGAVEITLGVVDDISSFLTDNSQKLAPLPFFKSLTLAIGQRKEALGLILKLQRSPADPAQLEVFLQFVRRYEMLTDALNELDNALVTYRDRLIADGKLPESETF